MAEIKDIAFDFDRDEPTASMKHMVPFDNIFFNDAKIHLLGSPVNTSTSSNTKGNSNLFARMLTFFRSAINPGTRAEFNRQCDQLLDMTKQPCALTDRVHARILFTIYRRLTNSREIFYSAYGAHWEAIGFQTNNPETDFRSAGVFSLFCLLYFVDSMYLPLAKQIYRLSQDETQQFPFCCVGINLANMIVRVLRPSASRVSMEKLVESKQGKSISESAATDLVGRLFIALYLNFYLKWRDNGCTIEHTQQVFSELEKTLIHRPRILFQQFDDYFRRKETETAQPRQRQYEVADNSDHLI